MKKLYVLKQNCVKSVPKLHQNINMYQKLFVMLTLLSDNTNTIFGQALTFEFIFIAVGVSGTIYGYRKHNLLLLTIVAMCTLLSLIFGFLMFNIGSMLYEISSVILKKWNNNSTECYGREGKLLQKSVTALRLLYAKAGSVSVINKKLLQGYSDALLQDTFTLLLLIKECL